MLQVDFVVTCTDNEYIQCDPLAVFFFFSFFFVYDYFCGCSFELCKINFSFPFSEVLSLSLGGWLVVSVNIVFCVR